VLPLLLVTVALSAPKPPGVDLDETSGWSAAAERLLDGPPGCYEVVGRATWAWDLGQFGFNRGDAVIVGRLHDGVWSGLKAVSLGEVARERKAPATHTYPDELRVRPLLGRLERSRSRRSSKGGDEAPTGSLQAVNLLRAALDDVTGDVEVVWATWEPTADAVVLHRSMGVGKGKDDEAVVRTRFPGGGLAPDALEVAFPEKWKADAGMVSAAITGSRVQVRAEVVGGVAFPRSEAVQMTASALGFTFSGAQTIAYRSFVPCAEGARRPLALPVEADDDAAELPGPAGATQP
jgi:hypothetical protein